MSLAVITDQRLYDPPVELRERPAGPVHLQEPGEVHPDLEQPEATDSTACAAGPEVLPDLSTGERPHLAGESH